jgi:sugar phosphate isomerase/epimerase
MDSDPAKVLDTVKMMGFTEIEGSAKIAPEEFRRLCDERGITIHLLVPATSNWSIRLIRW